MEITFQNAWACSYIKFRDTQIEYTKQFTNSINADYDKDDQLVGLEFVGGLEREMFKEIEVRILDEDVFGKVIKHSHPNREKIKRLMKKFKIKPRIRKTKGNK